MPPKVPQELSQELRYGPLSGRLPPDAMFPAGDDRFRVRFVKLPSGLRLRVVECGDERSSRTVVCVHGWACSVYSYRLVMPLLAAEGMRTVAMDLQGHGLSDKPGDAGQYTLDALVQSVVETMDALAIARATLIGHSMAGPICARMAVATPDRVAGLVLLAPAGFGTEWPIRLGAVLTPRFVGPLLPYVASRWLFALVLNMAYGTLRHTTEGIVDEYWAPSQFPGYTRAMWDVLHRFDWRAGSDHYFDHIRVPTAVLTGSLDRFVVRRWVTGYARVLDHAVIETIEGCGHVIAEEIPSAVKEAVLAVTG
ncbi:MAG: alpha/beta fold hydrolase [Gemmatimonadaceae bacterium]